MFDYSATLMQKLANTWSAMWCLQGCADINWNNYPMTEAWTILKFAPPINYYPTLRRGSKGAVVKDLQTKLNKKRGCNLGIDGIFGAQTLKEVIAFQTDNKLSPDGIVGPLTWKELNK
jgi:peptidoglycan hydrolase-like protein with peptidoglycan-binding domain